MNGIVTTLCLYWSEGIHPKTRLGKIIVPLIILKLSFILLLWAVFFGPSTSSDPDAPAIEAAVFHLPTAISREIRP